MEPFCSLTGHDTYVEYCRSLRFPNIPSTYQGIWPSDFLSSRCVDILRSLNEKNDTDYIIGGDRIVTINGSFLAPATIVSWLSLLVQGKQGKCGLPLTRRIRWGVDLDMANYSWIYDICRHACLQHTVEFLNWRVTFLEAHFVWWTCEPEAKELAGDEYQLMLYRYLPQEVHKDWHISTEVVWRMNFRKISNIQKKNGKDGPLGVAMWVLETMIFMWPRWCKLCCMIQPLG